MVYKSETCKRLQITQYQIRECLGLNAKRHVQIKSEALHP